MLYHLFIAPYWPGEVIYLTCNSNASMTTIGDAKHRQRNMDLIKLHNHVPRPFNWILPV